MKEIYSYGSIHLPEGSWWFIKKDEEIVFKMPFLEGDFDLEEPPEKLKEKYEHLIGWQSSSLLKKPFNIIESLSDDCAYDQPCIYGLRVEQHAVYCHNEAWLYAPKKCHRSIEKTDKRYYTNCPGFKSNPKFPLFEAQK